MKTSYTFKVVKSKSDTFNGTSNRELMIEVRYIQASAVNLFLKLQISDCLTANSIVFVGYNNDYLAGHFDLRLASELENALRDLIFKINNPSEDYTFISVKWEKFSRSFKEWFTTKLAPLLQKEFEASKLLFEELND